MMTQAKLKKTESLEDKKKNVSLNAEKNIKSKYFNEKCIQIAAWILLTLGLCIIVSTFYLAINQQVECPPENTGVEQDKNSGLDVDIVQKSASMSKKFIDLGNIAKQGCEEKFCKMICKQTENVFEALNQSMESSECKSFDALMVYNQYFDRGILRNNWIDGNYTVQELAILDSEVTTIKSGALNMPMFSTVFLMYWKNLDLQTVRSGALLGLNSLKYLTIDSKINCLDRAFFQPVQTTLLYLKIHAGLTMDKDQSIFGNSILVKLEYADLSRNNFNGPITEKTFQSTPNLKYLLLTNSKIKAIKDDAFKRLVGKLVLLDLSNNMLTTLSDKLLQPLLEGNTRFLINVAMNSFYCDCDIRPLVRVYTAYRGQFMEDLYCKAPHHLYGKCIDEVKLQDEHCDNDETTMHDHSNEEDNTTSKTMRPVTLATTALDDIVIDDVSKNVQMRCWHSQDSYESIESVPVGTEKSTDFNLIDAEPSSEISAIKYPIDTLRFAPRTHDFEVHLLENRTAKVIIIDDNNVLINVVWFGEDVENFSSDVPCITYAKPYIITDALIENTTYTFCIIPPNSNGISPFNCLPLYVEPKTEEDNIWIPRDQKQFTIGMLCLLFLMSTFAGAVIAYFGIRAYPDLLEGSKNVLVVKKCEKTCNVSTISEADYMKKSSLAEKSSSSSIKKSSLPETSTSVTSPSIISAAELERLSSMKSSSTFYEDAFNPMPCLDDEYEMPKPSCKDITYEGHSIPNTYVPTSPTRSPPPLPKRNSSANITDYAF